MNIRKFRVLLDARGPDMSRWPARDRSRAERLLARSAEARAVLDEAKAFDSLLAHTLGRGNAGATLREAVLRLPSQHPREARRRVRRFSAFAHPWRIGLAAATASALLGFVVGLSGFAPSPDNPEITDLAALVYGQSFDGEALP